MNKINKKEIRKAVDGAITKILLKFNVSSPSKKTRKLLNNLSKRIIQEIKKKGKAPKKLTKPIKKVSSKRVKKERKI